jgi:hypothetical protein
VFTGFGAAGLATPGPRSLRLGSASGENVPDRPGTVNAPAREDAASSGDILAAVPDATIEIRVQTRAGRDEIVGLRDGVLIVRTTAPPVDGMAPEALLARLTG